MRAHLLKTIDPYFYMVETGIKKFEIRNDDRVFKLGDVLVLARWHEGRFTGERLYRRVSYIFTGGQFGLEAGYVVMGIEKIRADRHARADRAVAGVRHA